MNKVFISNDGRGFPLYFSGIHTCSKRHTNKVPAKQSTSRVCEIKYLTNSMKSGAPLWGVFEGSKGGISTLICICLLLEGKEKKRTRYRKTSLYVQSKRSV